MSETKRDYEIGYGKPPRGRPFQKAPPQHVQRLSLGRATQRSGSIASAYRKVD